MGGPMLLTVFCKLRTQYQAYEIQRFGKILNYTATRDQKIEMYASRQNKQKIESPFKYMGTTVTGTSKTQPMNSLFKYTGHNENHNFRDSVRDHSPSRSNYQLFQMKIIT